MSSDVVPRFVNQPPDIRPPRARVRARKIAAHATLLAHGEPMVWLTGGSLVVALMMVAGLVGLVVSQGVATFWPTPLVQLRTLDGSVILGEDTRQETYKPSQRVFADLLEQIKPQVRAALDADQPLDRAGSVLGVLEPDVVKLALQQRGESDKASDTLVNSLAEKILAHAKRKLAADGSAVRRSYRTGNFEINQTHFRWVNDFAVLEHQQPPWALLLERMEQGRFYGFPSAFVVDDAVVATEPADVWNKFQEFHAASRQRLAKKVDLATDEVGAINRRAEALRLMANKVKLDYGADSPQYQLASQRQATGEQADAADNARIEAEIAELNRENNRYQMRFKTAEGQESTQVVADIVRAVPANQLTLAGKWGVYFSRWHEFLFDVPRNANSEGGVFPAIWGTVVMTLVMTLLVVPFGVLAALYLREYAKPGLLTSAVRISINNLAGVPSIVFGVFGLGFFCYVLGAGVDRTFFPASYAANQPVFSTGGLMWASFTLALLTLPVVIVATEEALTAVPNSMREGSYACGASKWQTIQRIVLPRALPGIMTGTILAMARGAGEVAPLMLVGVVKIAPDLPIDRVFPFVHPQRSFMHLGFHIYDVGFQSQNAEASKPLVYTTTLLLILIVATLNIAAIWLRGRLRRKFVSVQF